LLRLELSRARVSLSGLKTDRGATIGGARGIINVTGCIGPFYPNIVVFSVLDPKGNLVF
jgi:hypothetical protein